MPAAVVTMPGARAFGALVIAAVAIGGVLFAARDRLIPLALQFAMPTDFFESETRKPDEFVGITAGVFAFRHGFNRSLVVDAGEKLAVFDTFTRRHVEALRNELAMRFPGKPVGWVFYSHHHLDHIRGAAALSPESVIAHADVMSYVDDFDYVDDVLPVTSTFDGDASITIGDVRVDLHYLPRSHSETLYAFHLPEQRVLFLPDLMFKDAFPPFGFPDWYYPGYVRALDRLLAIEATHYVPTHFGIGTRDDLESYRDMMVDFRETVVAALAVHDYDAADGARLRRVLRSVYPALAKRHGHRIGFNAMFLPHFGGQAGGTYLGF